MAGWTCGPGDWARLFNDPDLDKFDGPSVDGVDFPRVALSEARWDGEALHLAAQARAPRETKATTATVCNLADTTGWVMLTPEGETIALHGAHGRIEVNLKADNRTVIVRRAAS